MAKVEVPPRSMALVLQYAPGAPEGCEFRVWDLETSEVYAFGPTPTAAMAAAARWAADNRKHMLERCGFVEVR